MVHTLSPSMIPLPPDCGVFAIAFAMAICNGQNPKELTFNSLQAWSKGACQGLSTSKAKRWKA